jgi:hypothetical protein
MTSKEDDSAPARAGITDDKHDGQRPQQHQQQPKQPQQQQPNARGVDSTLEVESNSGEIAKDNENDHSRHNPAPTQLQRQQQICTPETNNARTAGGGEKKGVEMSDTRHAGPQRFQKARKMFSR